MRETRSVSVLVSRSGRWVSWELGELSDAVWQTADLLASATTVEYLAVEPPAAEGGAPRVLVVVPDQVAVMRLATVVKGRGGFVGFVGRFEQRRWTADLGDLVLTVATWDGLRHAAHGGLGEDVVGFAGEL
jgi:hypothetical protein